MDHLVFALQPAGDAQHLPGDHRAAVLFEKLAPDDDAYPPVSFSSVRETTLLAVPGRWRRITSPATATRAPCGGRSSISTGKQEGGRGHG